MLVSASYFGGMRFNATPYEQAMMVCIQTRGMWNRPIRDGPLRVYGALFEIDRRDVAVTVHNVSHRDIQSLAGRLDHEARGISARQRDAAQEFGCPGVNNFHRGAHGGVVAAATRVHGHRRILEGLDAGV